MKEIEKGYYYTLVNTYKTKCQNSFKQTHSLFLTRQNLQNHPMCHAWIKILTILVRLEKLLWNNNGEELTYEPMEFIHRDNMENIFDLRTLLVPHLQGAHHQPF